MLFTGSVKRDEKVWVAILEGFVLANVVVISDPEFPGRLYHDTEVVYRTEGSETWSTADQVLAQGWDDCDSLATWLAASIRVYGSQALLPGTPGHTAAERYGVQKAQAYLETRVPKGARGLFHCLVRYQVNGTWYREDPSERLGMNGVAIDPTVLRLRADRGLRGVRCSSSAPSSKTTTSGSVAGRPLVLRPVSSPRVVTRSSARRSG